MIRCIVQPKNDWSGTRGDTNKSLKQILLPTAHPSPPVPGPRKITKNVRSMDTDSRIRFSSLLTDLFLFWRAFVSSTNFLIFPVLKSSLEVLVWLLSLNMSLCGKQRLLTVTLLRHMLMRTIHLMVPWYRGGGTINSLKLLSSWHKNCKEIFTVVSRELFITTILTIFTEILKNLRIISANLSKNCWMSGKQCQHCLPLTQQFLHTVFTLFAQACQSE